MNLRVAVQPRAWHDIDETCDHLTEHYSAVSVEAWYDGCMQAIDSLAVHPERCQIARASARLGIELRPLPYRRYRSVCRILFVIRDDIIRVVCVRHSARDRLTREDLPAEDLP